MNYCIDCEDIFDKSNLFCHKCGRKGMHLFSSNEEEFKYKSNKYLINNDLPSSIKFNSKTFNDLYKKDISGLQAYLKERENFQRIFIGITWFIRNGCSVKQFLRQLNLMNDKEIMSITAQGFIDVSTFLKNMLELNENIELRKDYNACIEAVEILKKNNPDPYEDPYEIVHYNLKALYKEEYLFAQSIIGSLMNGTLKNEEMTLKYILTEYKNNLSKMYVKAHKYTEITNYIAEFLNDFSEPDQENILGYIMLEQLHSCTSKCSELFKSLSIIKLAEQKK